MDDIMHAYQASFEDHVFSRKEKRAIVSRLKELAPDKHDLARLRSRIFDLARTHATPENTSAILDWLEVANKTLLTDTTPEWQSDVYFSPNDDCASVIIRQLESAVSRIRICVFTISDNRVRDSIIQRARDGIRVQIMTDNDKVYDYGSDIQEIANAGIEVRVDRTEHHMHHKFAVFDELRAMTGSYNWTRSANAYNQENILVTQEKGVVDAYLKEFRRLWKMMKPYA